MLAGRRLLESLIVFSKIEVVQSIKHIKQPIGEDQELPTYKMLDAKSIEEELTNNK